MFELTGKGKIVVGIVIAAFLLALLAFGLYLSKDTGTSPTPPPAQSPSPLIQTSATPSQIPSENPSPSQTPSESPSAPPSEPPSAPPSESPSENPSDGVPAGYTFVFYPAAELLDAQSIAAIKQVMAGTQPGAFRVVARTPQITGSQRTLLLTLLSDELDGLELYYLPEDYVNSGDGIPVKLSLESEAIK